MGKKRRSFSKEFRLEAVRLVKEGGMSVNRAAQDLGIHATSLGRWVQQYAIDHGEGAAGLTSQEKEELRRLRRENNQLRMEREILKKATAFFAKEGE